MKKIIAHTILALLVTTSSAFADSLDSYIIKFNDSYKEKSDIPKALLRQKISIDFTKSFKSALSGIAVDLTKKQVEHLLNLPFIDTIEKDTVNTMDINWSQDRIDQKSLPLNSSFNVTNGGIGANIYIVDTGINTNHTEFTGRIGTVTSTIAGGETNDCNGHGTHIASIAAGKKHGVAPEATINSIRISHDCDGRAKTSDMIEAFEWIINNGQPNSIINFSYNFTNSSVMHAMNSAIADGHVIVSSAGNNSINACHDTTTKYKQHSSIVVGSSTSSDVQSTFSNYGSCIDLYAPGSSIKAASYLSNTSTKIYSGTSMAAPIVTGLAAGYRSTYPNATPQEVFQAIISSSSHGKLSGLGEGSPNKLAYNILTVPSAYWQKTKKTIEIPVAFNSFEPFSSCIVGEKTLQTYRATSFYPTSNYRAVVWECK